MEKLKGTKILGFPPLDVFNLKCYYDLSCF